MPERITHVVAGRLGEQRLREELAARGSLGQAVTTLPGLAARLAGGFARPAGAAEVRAALQEPPLTRLTSLAELALMPGFARAATRTLNAVWAAGVDLSAQAPLGGRWAELAALEEHVAASLDDAAMLPPRLVASARERARLAPRVTGAVTLHPAVEVPPLYRPLVADLVHHVPVTWHGAAAPAWLPAGVTRLEPPDAALPGTTVVSCADSEHEALEALRWVRALLASGRRPEGVVIAAADPGVFDDTVRSLAAHAGIPLHSAHGVPALSTPAGQVAAALADALARGPGQTQVRRLLAAARAARTGKLGLLPEGWADEVPREAPLTDEGRWRRALGPLTDREPQLAEIVMRLVADLGAGLPAAARVGEAWLDGDAALLWRRALADGPAGVLGRTLLRIRVADGVDPATSVLWGPAAALTAWPRPYARLLGLSARAWPRRGTDEDPLLPERLRPGLTLRERTLAQRDTDDFTALAAAATGELVVSWPRRDETGRVLPRSHLLASLRVDRNLEVPRAAADRAVTEADRRASRPGELASDPAQRRAAAAYRAGFAPSLTPYDGLVTPRHPAIAGAIARTQSATSLRELLLNPHGFVVRYALGWRRPEPQTELLALDPAAFGSLLHEVLEAAARSGTHTGVGGDPAAAVTAACLTVAADWEARFPVPPAVLWRRTLAQVEEWATWSLTTGAPPSAGAESHTELLFGYEWRRPERADLPWDPAAVVEVPGTSVKVRGVIDRLDVDRARRAVRVIDYKSGKPAQRLGGLEGGKELQRTLYTVAVRQLLGPDWSVEALLVHPRQRVVLTLPDPDSQVPTLAAAVTLATESLLAGNAVAGPELASPYEDAQLAFPAYGAPRYLALKGAAIGDVRRDLDALLGGAS